MEPRIWEVFHDLDELADFRQAGWTGLNSIVRIQYAQLRNHQWITTLTRYFITSLASDAQQIMRTVRSHWHIENKLHRVLDITFRQDDSRIRVEHSPQNSAVIQHVALNLLKKHPKNVSIRRKRMQSARNDDLRWEILTAFEL